MNSFWTSVLWTLVGAAISAVVTFFLTKRHFEKELREHPPVTEKQIRAMYMSMGRKPSEAQIRQTMKAFKQHG